MDGNSNPWSIRLPASPGLITTRSSKSKSSNTVGSLTASPQSVRPLGIYGLLKGSWGLEPFFFSVVTR